MSSARFLSLYARILRAHRKKLPTEMRHLGDSYVKEEFRRHKNADQKWMANFYKEWEIYLSNLTHMDHSTGPGRDLSEDDVMKLSDEQRQQLRHLQLEAERFRSEK